MSEEPRRESRGFRRAEPGGARFIWVTLLRYPDGRVEPQIRDRFIPEEHWEATSDAGFDIPPEEH